MQTWTPVTVKYSAAMAASKLRYTGMLSRARRLPTIVVAARRRPRLGAVPCAPYGEEPSVSPTTKKWARTRM